MKLKYKLGYAVGDMGISISYFAVGFFFMYYLTDIVKLDPLLAGIAFFVGKLWDGINDPFMGILSDRTVSRYGRKRVYILFGAFPLALTFILLWLIPLSANEWIQFFLAIITLSLYATAYTVVVVPYMAMIPAMSNDYDERTQITGLRAILSTFGTILGGGAAMLLSSFTDEVLGLRGIAIGFGFFTFITLLIASQSIKGMETTSTNETSIMEFNLRDYIGLAKEKNVIILLSLKFLGAIATGSLSAALPYFAKHVLGDEGKSSIGLAIYIAVSAIFIPVWNRLTKQYDKRRLLLIGTVLSAIILFSIGFFVQEENIKVFYGGCFLLGMAMSSYLLIPYSLVPDLVDFYEFKTGVRHESVYFGLWITVHQLGISVAGLILGGVLAIFGYQGELTLQTESAIFAIRLSFGLIPGLFFVLAAFVVQNYTVTRNAFIALRAELERKVIPPEIGATGG